MKIDHCFEEYGKSWYFKKYCDAFREEQKDNPNLKKLSELKEGDVFHCPGQRCRYCLIAENRYFNYEHVNILHDIQHVDPHAFVLILPQYKWDMATNTLIKN